VRNVRRVCDGGRRGRRTSREMVRSEISTPSLPNSPWIRGAPQSGFAAAIFITSARMAAVVLGRPERPRAERRVPWRRSHWRCHRTTVSRCTTTSEVRQLRHTLARTDPERAIVRANLRPRPGAGEDVERAYGDGDLSDAFLVEEKRPNPQISRLLSVRFGARWRARRRTIRCCLSRRFSAISARAPLGPHSFAVVTARWSKGDQDFLQGRDSVGQTSGATQPCLNPGFTENWQFETNTSE
jgi:hypothetical protein